MLDLSSETLLTIRQAAKRTLGRSGRRGVHVSAVYRWAQRGMKGVRLETQPVGGALFTSVEALQRFSDAQARARGCYAPRTPSAASKAAREELERNGF